MMTDVTRILSQIEQGDSSAAEQLLPLVYDELRRLAAAKLANEKPGQTLQATALVHEAYMRLVGAEQAPKWDSRRHFFSAAAESMRRILVEKARRKRRLKRGGEARRDRVIRPRGVRGDGVQELHARGDGRVEVHAFVHLLGHLFGDTLELAVEALIGLGGELIGAHAAAGRDAGFDLRLVGLIVTPDAIEEA